MERLGDVIPWEQGFAMLGLIFLHQAAPQEDAQRPGFSIGLNHLFPVRGDAGNADGIPVPGDGDKSLHYGTNSKASTATVITVVEPLTAWKLTCQTPSTEVPAVVW